MNVRPISVLHFSNSRQRGGAEQHVLTLLKGLDREYFRLYFVCTPELREKMRPDIPDDVTVFPLALQSPAQLVPAARLAQILCRARINVLHSHLFYGSRYASPIGWFCRVPVIIETPHVREHWRRGWKANFTLDRCISKFVDYHVAVSSANAQYLTQIKHLPREKIAVIHNGCDVRRFSAPQGNTFILRKQLGFGENDPVLVLPGRLEPQKGHSVLLEALPEILREFPLVKVVFIGDGALRAELGAAISHRTLGKSVRLVGYQDNMEQWLSLGDVTVLPSFYEGLPLVAMESLAAGRPVVATAVDGTPEVVIDGETGLTVPPGDPVRLAEAIRYLLRDPENARRFGHQGRDHVSQKFTHERQIQRTQDLYCRALNEVSQVRRVRIPALPDQIDHVGTRLPAGRTR